MSGSDLAESLEHYRGLAPRYDRRTRFIDAMNAGITSDALQRAVPIHPTVSELIPTVLGELA